MPSVQWVYAWQAEQEVLRLSRELGISRVLASLLMNRGIQASADARAFLEPDPASMHDPMLFRDMEKAVARLRHAHKEQEHIRIFGDYDADGSCGSAVLVSIFRLLGIEHSVRLPSRHGTGYGLSVEAVQEAVRDGVKVLITVDNGISANVPVNAAQDAGIDVIVTDHHKFGPELPRAFALIHPGLLDSGYPFGELCGASVAFKLALGLAGTFGIRPEQDRVWRNFVADSFALCAIASVCDMVPLTGENRIIASVGLKALAGTGHPGLRALLELANVTGSITSTDIGFKIGPRINAAGRMGQEKVALALLTCREYSEGMELASELDGLNKQRQQLERRIVTEAKAEVERLGPGACPHMLLVAGESWPSGVAGLVASRLADTYNKPALVLGFEGDGAATGSGRSTRDFHLYNALADAGHLLDRFGGHTFAAGLTVQQARIDELRAHLNEHALKHRIFTPGTPSLDIDTLIEPEELTQRLAEDVQRLEPFGEGNREPLLAIEGARLVGRPRLVGKTAKHLSFQVAPCQGSALRAIGFKLADQLDLLEASARSLNLAFKPILSTWTGNPVLELEVKHLAPCMSVPA